MIIFTDINPTIIKDWYSVRKSTNDINRLFLSNLCSNYLGINSLMGILPDQSIMSKEAILNPESQQFDIEYSQYLDNGYGFIPLMTQIVAPEFNNSYDVHVIFVEFSPYQEAVIEALSNLMFGKYSVKSFIVRTVEDLDYSLTQIPTLNYPIISLLNLTNDINKLG